MSLTKTVQGDYNINTINAAGDAANDVTITTANLRINGDLVVTGTSENVLVTNLAISNNTILLNEGEEDEGVTEVHSGIEIDRGTALNVGIRYDDSLDAWQLTHDGTIWEYIVSDVSSNNAGMSDVVDDLTPQLGGNLDVNSMTITSASNGDVVLDANGTGQVKINNVLSLEEQGAAPSSTSSYNKLYSATPGEGGTGLYFVNSTSSDELVSKTKAMVYGLIF